MCGVMPLVHRRFETRVQPEAECPSLFREGKQIMAQHTHELDCRQCGAHFDSREELDRHNRDTHTQQASRTGGDATERDTARSDRGTNDQSIL